MCLHAEVPAAAFLRLAHLRISRASLLRRAGRRNQRRVDRRAHLERQALVLQEPVDRRQYPGRQLMRFKQVPEAQDRALVGQPCHARAQQREPPLQRDVVQRLLHRRVRETEPLHEVNAQHRCDWKRRAPGQR